MRIGLLYVRVPPLSGDLRVNELNDQATGLVTTFPAGVWGWLLRTFTLRRRNMSVSKLELLFRNTPFADRIIDTEKHFHLSDVIVEIGQLRAIGRRQLCRPKCIFNNDLRMLLRLS